MPAAFIEHRPYSTSEYAATSHYVIVVNGQEVGGSFTSSSQKFGLRKRVQTGTCS